MRPERRAENPLIPHPSVAAFAAVVIGQAANAFACRDTARWPGALGWTTNRLLLVGVGVELLLLGPLLFLEPVATLLGQAPPTVIGWLVAMLAAPGGPAGGRGAQAPVGRSSTATIVGLKAGVGRPTTPAGPR